MRMPWDKSKVGQLDLVDDANEALIERLNADVVARGGEASTSAPSRALSLAPLFVEGVKAYLLLVPIDRLEEDPANPRTAAIRCGITQPRINDLLRGRVSRFSIDALVKCERIATAFG